MSSAGEVARPKRVLIVDDELSMREMLAILLKKAGLDVRTAGSRAEAAQTLGAGPVDLVLTDVKLPDGDGLEILRHVKAAAPETPVVVMTAYGTTEMAVAARKLGAEAYILKPFDVDELRIVVRDALANRTLREENVRLKREVGQAYGLDRVVGVSEVMASLFEMVRAIAPTSSTVLITGESGTGKELVARAIHGLSGRARGALRQRQLRRAAREPARKRAVRLRQGRLHRREAEQEGPVRGRARRHAVPRRGRRDVAPDAGQAAARGPGAQDPACRRHRGEPGGRARGCS